MPGPDSGDRLMDFGANIALEALSTFALDPVSRAAKMLANRKYVLSMPQPDQIFLMWLSGKLTADEVGYLLGCHGINVGQVVPKNELGIDDKTVTKAWQQWGWQMMKRPNTEAALRARWREIITAEDLNDLAKLEGAEKKWWTKISPIYQDWPSPGELAILCNRQIFTPDEYRNYLRRGGGYEDKVIDWYEELRHAIPSMADLVHMEAKEAFTVPVANSLGLYDEFPGSMMPYAAAQGFDRDLPFQVQSDGQQVNANWPLLWWAAHWTPISPGQIYTMLQRLRPDAVARYQVLGLNVAPFARADANRWLRYQNFPPGIRDSLLAIAYRPVPIRNLKLVWRAQTVDRDYTLGALQDNGYAADTAETLIQSWDQEEIDADQRRLDRQEEALQRKLADRILAGYEQGLIGDQDARDSLSQMGWRQSMIEIALREIDLKQFEGDTKTMLRAVKREVMMGGVAIESVGDLLANMGIVPPVIQRLTTQWRFELSLPRRSFATERILKYYRSGLLQRDDAQQRLETIGWQSADVLLMLEDADLSIMKLQQKEYEVGLRHANAQAKALEKLQTESARQFTKAQQALRKITPPSRVVRLLKKREVSADWAERRLAAIGEPAESIALYMADAGVDITLETAKEAEKAVKAEEAQAKLIPLADLGGLFKSGKLDAASYSKQLSERGMTDQQIAEEIAKYGPTKA